MGLLSSIFFSTVVAGAVSLSPVYGPISMTNHHPLYVGLLYPTPERAEVSEAPYARAAVNHTNIYLINYGRKWSVAVDKELTQLNLTAAYPMMDGKMEASVNAALFHSYEGFMDSAIRWWHNLLRVKGYTGQADAPDYRFMDIVRHDGRDLVDGARGAALGDLDFGVKMLVYRDSNLTVSGQAFVHVPTGDADSGYGSGSWEGAARALAEMRGDWYTLHAGLGAVAPSQMKRNGQTVDLDAMLTGFVAAEAPVWDGFNIVVQSMYNTSPLPSADIYQLTRDWVEITFGFKYRAESGKTFGFGFSENLNQTAPDFTIHLSVEGALR